MGFSKAVRSVYDMELEKLSVTVIERIRRRIGGSVRNQSQMSKTRQMSDSEHQDLF